MDKTFKEIMIEAIDQRGVSIDKLSEQSRIPKRYLEHIVRGEFNSLPPAPYLHGYITRLAGVLELDGDLLWNVYKKENSIKISGSEDRLPINRFALQTISNTKVLVVSGLIVISLLYITLRFNSLFGQPSITIIDPSTETLITNQSTYTIKGSADIDIKVTINDDLVSMDNNGSFSQAVLLQEGLNTFTIKASKFLGRETSTLRQIIFQTNSEQTTTSPPPTSKTTPVEPESQAELINTTTEE